MINIHVSEDFESAPEKQFVRDYNAAFVEADIEKILSMMADDASWHLSGDKTYSGKDEIRAALESMGLEAGTELRIDNIIGRGDRCAANGTMTFSDVVVNFCDIYQFTGSGPDAKIKQLVSYGVESK